MKPVRIVAKNPPIDIEIPMGNGPAYPTGGFGGWVPVDVQDDVSVTDWEGQAPLTEDVPLLLNGYETGESVQREWNTVKKLGRDPNGEETRPPVFVVHGPVDHPGKAWVLGEGGIEVNPASIFTRSDGDYLRIEFTLHLLEYGRPDVIRRRGANRARVGVGQPRTYTTRKGDTLISIAVAIYGNWKRAKEIGDKNGIHDPNRVLPANRILNLP